MVAGAIVIRNIPLTIGLAAAVLAACSRGTTRDDPVDSTSSPTLTTVDTVTVELPVSLPAQLYVEHDAWVYARSLGVVESLAVDLGARVEEGDLLVSLEHEEQAIALDEARAIVANAERAVARQRQLAGSRLVSPADSERVEYEYQRAELALRKAQRDYRLTRIVAPFDGRVTTRVVKPGQLVQPGDSLFRVAALAPLRVTVHVPEDFAAETKVGATAEVIDLAESSAEARVIAVSPIIDAASGTLEVLLQLGPNTAMRPGQLVTVYFVTVRRKVLAVDPAAVAEEGYVLVWENGRSVLREVTLGATLPDGRVEVVTGLTAGDQVVRPTP